MRLVHIGEKMAESRMAAKAFASRTKGAKRTRVTPNVNARAMGRVGKDREARL
jgi:hypothetical protein